MMQNKTNVKVKERIYIEMSRVTYEHVKNIIIEQLKDESGSLFEIVKNETPKNGAAKTFFLEEFSAYFKVEVSYH